ncbi:MAG: Rieske 2Fe-2S domain-containing protein [Candidatus Marsarchaeota archaeon]|nr:Rieske 2Fe-2S domain-containing protein [Candidatus Marsarchaeota archaeon]
MAQKKVCSEKELGEGALRAFDVDGRSIVLYRKAGRIYAFDRWCTHEQGDLAAGTVEQETVTCPDHGSQFNLGERGKNVVGPDGDPGGSVPDLPVFKASVVNGDVFVDL